MTYQASSGLFSDRHTERTVITLDGTQCERTGEEGGPVNRGAWEVEAVVGSGETLYKFEYQGGGWFGLWYRQGDRYTNAESITVPIRELVRGLMLPEDACSLLLLRSDGSPHPEHQSAS